MNLERFEQFKKDSNVVIKSSEWITAEIDKAIALEEYYAANPYLDNADDMDLRILNLIQLQKRAEWENRNHDEHKKKYDDMMK